MNHQKEDKKIGSFHQMKQYQQNFFSNRQKESTISYFQKDSQVKQFDLSPKPLDSQSEQDKSFYKRSSKEWSQNYFLSPIRNYSKQIKKPERLIADDYSIKTMCNNKQQLGEDNYFEEMIACESTNNTLVKRQEQSGAIQYNTSSNQKFNSMQYFSEQPIRNIYQIPKSPLAASNYNIQIKIENNKVSEFKNQTNDNIKLEKTLLKNSRYITTISPIPQIKNRPIQKKKKYIYSLFDNWRCTKRSSYSMGNSQNITLNLHKISDEECKIMKKEIGQNQESYQSSPIQTKCYKLNKRMRSYYKITPEERKRKIQTYKEKRRKRNWNCKYFYTQRSKLAVVRLRYKGRFIKTDVAKDILKAEKILKSDEIDKLSKIEIFNIWNKNFEKKGLNYKQLNWHNKTTAKTPQVKSLLIKKEE